MHWCQNIAERHRINGQRNVYSREHPEDANLTAEALRNILDENSDELKKIMQRMQKFNANITGGNPYFCKKREELEALIKQEGMCTTWFAFSAADNHWLDLNKIIYGDRPLPVFHTEKEKCK